MRVYLPSPLSFYPELVEGKERAGGEAFVRAVSVHTVHKTVHIVESLASAINTAEVRGLSTFHGFLYLLSDAFFFDFSDLFFTFACE